MIKRPDSTVHAAWRVAAVVLAVAVLSVGCARTPPDRRSDETTTPDFPAHWFDPTAARVFDLEPAASTLRVFVFRAGAFAAQGHNHVIAAGDFRAAVAWPRGDDELAGVRAALWLPVEALVVDPPAQRRELGGAFSAVLEEAARVGTRENMLSERLLASAAHPHVAVTLDALEGEPPRLIATFSVMVRGRTARIATPVAVTGGDERIRIRGSAIIRHSDLGLEPFSVLGGALRVADAMIVEFDLVGRRRDG